MKKRDYALIILGILFISFNLRAPITAVGSVVELIMQEYKISSAAAGFITTLPLIAFAIVSPFVAKISSKIGHSLTMMLGLICILVGEICRSYTGVYGLYIGTAIMGIGIAIGNVIIPAIIKLYFSKKVGAVTSLYTSGMCIFAAVGAGISIPLAKGMNLGWKNSLASWFILTMITVLIWLPQILKKKETNKKVEKTESKTSVWKSPLAWWVTMFMGIQSFIFYSIVAWLPTIVISKEMTDTFAGNMALMFQLMAIPATLLIPILSDKFKNQKGLSLVVCTVYIIGVLLFLFAQTQIMIIIAIILMAIGMGGSISLSIAFISLRSPNSSKASELSGMSQSAGYLFAAAGPILTGLIFDMKSSWTIPLSIFMLLIVALAVCGIFAGSDKTIEE